MENKLHNTLINTIGKFLLGLMLVFATPLVWAAETITYYHNDALGSPIAATDENGKILWKEDYHPYGSRIRKESTDTNQQWYTGKHHENDIGLTYFGARWYDPSIGRFMAIDPAGFKESNIQSHNRYAYANNNPYLFVDPDGRENDIVTGFIDDPREAAEYLGSEGNPRMDFLDFEGEGILTPASGVAVSAKLTGKVVAKGGSTVIGRVKDLKKLKSGERSLLDRLPNKGSPKANWKQNSGVLRQEMSKGRRIRDASPDDLKGPFLNAERNLLKSRGWTFDKGSNNWNPPKP